MQVHQLARMMKYEGLPLPFALHVFNVRLEASFSFSRWLWVGLDDIGTILNDAYAHWARILLDAKPWRKPAPLLSELGWHLTGEGRLLVDVASTWARDRLRPSAECYSLPVSECTQRGLGWSGAAMALFRKWGVPLTGGTIAWCRAELVEHAVSQSAESWRDAAGRSAASIPYLCFQGSRCQHMSTIMFGDLPWDTLSGCRAWVRLRTNLIDLTHINKRPVSEGNYSCIFCSVRPVVPMEHVIAECNCFLSTRLPLVLAAGWHNPDSAQVASAFLRVGPSSPIFCRVVKLAHAIDCAADDFWDC